jgi:poly-gamma-glutamate capsule biosynthesis protein CapA/YwtB (metallophosphatase superfamily)
MKRLFWLTLTLTLGVGQCACAGPGVGADAGTRMDSEKPAPKTRVRVSAVGDIMLGGTAGPELRQFGYDYPFVHVRDFFQGSQIVFGNLEGPLTTRGTPDGDKKYVFRSPPQKVAPALKRAGFTVVSLANNHTLDYGAEGLRDTIEALDQIGIGHAGAGDNLHEARRPALIRVHGQTVALLAYSVTLPETFYAEKDKPGTAFAHEAQVRSDVAKARQAADIVIVSFHWGQEGKTELRDYQVKLGHTAIDAGAAAVIGHHPHILQGIEQYKDGVILYSLGNFVFGSFSETAKDSVIAQLDFIDGRVSALHLVPINVNNVELDFRPQPLKGAQADAVIARLQRLSEERHTQLANAAGVGVLMPAAAVAQTAPAGQ